MSATWTAIARCGTCGEEINRAEHVPTEDKARVGLASPLVGFCPTRSHNTLSDINFNVRVEWIVEEVSG